MQEKATAKINVRSILEMIFLLIPAPLLLCFRAHTIAEPRGVNHPEEEMTAPSLKEETASFSTLLILVISHYSFHSRQAIK